MENQLFHEKALETLLKDPELTLETFLSHPSLAHWLKNLTLQKDLVGFLFQDDNPIKIFQYAICNEMDIPNFKKLHSASLLFFSISNEKGLKIHLLHNQDFVQHLISFTQSEYLNNCLVCSNYSKIIYSFMSSPARTMIDPKLINETFAFIPAFLSKHIHILAFRELFLNLIFYFQERIPLSEQIFLNMFQSNSDSKFSIFFALHTILAILQEKPSIHAFLDDLTFGRLLMKLGIDNYEVNALLATEAFQIFSLIHEKTLKKNYETILAETDFKPTKVNFATANYLALFPSNLDLFIIPFFQFRSNTFLNEQIVSIFRTLPKSVIQTMICKDHLNFVIMDAFDSYEEAKTNGHFLELAKIIDELKFICCKDHEIDWKLFLLQKLTGRWQLATKKPDTISSKQTVVHLSSLKPNFRPKV